MEKGKGCGEVTNINEQKTTLLNPDMPAQELRLHMGELTANEVRVARAAIRWANSKLSPHDASDISNTEHGI